MSNLWSFCNVSSCAIHEQTVCDILFLWSGQSHLAFQAHIIQALPMWGKKKASCARHGQWSQSRGNENIYINKNIPVQVWGYKLINSLVYLTQLKTYHSCLNLLCLHLYMDIHLRVCIYCIASNYKHKVLQPCELWMGYWHRSVPSGTVFYFCCGETERSQRERERERERRRRDEEDLRMKTNWEVVVQIELKRWRTTCLTDSRRHTHTHTHTPEDKGRSPVLSVCVLLIPAALKRWTHKRANWVISVPCGWISPL